MKERKAKIIGEKGPSHLNGGQNWMWRKKEGERKNKIERQKRKKLERKKETYKIKRQDGQRCRCDIKSQVLAAEP